MEYRMPWLTQRAPQSMNIHGRAGRAVAPRRQIRSPRYGSIATRAPAIIEPNPIRISVNILPPFSGGRNAQLVPREVKVLQRRSAANGTDEGSRRNI